MQASTVARRFMHTKTYFRGKYFFKTAKWNLTLPAMTTKLSERRSSSQHLPFWTPGSGYYGKTLGPNNKQIIENSSDFILEHVDTVPVRDDGVFTVADYGTNDGFTSMNLMGRIIDQLRKKHGEKLPIQVIYEDQEKNDFNSLFTRLSDGTGYLSKHSNVYTFATNFNFYKQCVPDGTCDVIFTSIATQWLDKPSANFKDGIMHSTANGDNEEFQHFFAEAERDWTKFLLLRARELKKGGLLIALTLGTSDDFQHGTAENSTQTGEGEKRSTAKSPVSIQGSGCLDQLLDLDAIWRQFKQENIITQREYETCLVTSAYRTPKEERAPFETANSPVVQAGLSLEYYDQILHELVFKELWREKQRTEGADDRAYFAELTARAYTVAIRTSFENSLSDSRSAEDKEAILDELYKRFEARVVVRNPETYRGDYIVNRLVARKV